MESTLKLSVIIPAYNEERRVALTLVQAVDYLDQLGISYEIIVVNDGSTDNTASVVKKFEKIKNPVHLCNLENNIGKGGAVKAGVLSAKGEKVLFMDADGATPMPEFEKLDAALVNGVECVFASRAIFSKETKVATVWYRKYPGRIFNFLVNTILLGEVSDTQCGFKLFSKKAADFLFSKQTIMGFGFDVEILYLARKAGIVCKEVPINWTNIPGSKVSLLKDSVRMFIEILIIKFRHRKIDSLHYASFF